MLDDDSTRRTYLKEQRQAMSNDIQELSSDEREDIVDFLHKVSVLWGGQDIDAEKYDNVFDSMGRNANTNEEAASKLTKAAEESAQIAKQLESSYKSIPPPPALVGRVYELWALTWKKYVDFADLRYQKALKKQFRFLRPNQIGLIIRHQQFSRTLYKASRTLISTAGQ